MKHTPHSFLAMKRATPNTPIPMLTAYTTPVAKCLEHASVPILLVGDSVGMVEMGFNSTREVTIDHMAYHVGAVRRGAPNTHIIGDMPYQTDEDPYSALINAHKLIDAGADSVKLEGAKLDVIAHLVDNDIDVVGHTGLLPQTAENFKKVGKDAEEAKRILQEARAIEDAGAFMLVIEHTPASLAKNITAQLKIPTIGIGAGAECDGQVLVINDAIGFGGYLPPFAKQYAQIGETIEEAARQFMHDVQEKTFPSVPPNT